jgi:succinate-semialdehyde dehydrogenase/glutarate-semialdehyde dehydrogenase
MSYTTINPQNGQDLSTYTYLKKQDIENCLQAAESTYHDWSRTPLKQRQADLLKLEKVLLENKNEFSDLITLEMGKITSEAIAEIEKCAELCRHYATHLQTYYHQIQQEQILGAPLNTHVELHLEPLGIVLGIMPWNFPFWQVLRAAIPIIASGNVFILKHASNCFGCGKMIAMAFQKAGFQEGIFQNLIITSATALELISDNRIVGVTFTGSASTGSIIAAQAGHNLKRSVLELGGIDAALILDSNVLSSTVSKIIAAKFSNCGQVCIAPKRIIILKTIYQEFLDELVQQMQHITLPPMARADLRITLHQQVTDSIEQGAKLLLGGVIPEGRGNFYPPTALTDVKPGMIAFDEEIFGPVISLVCADDVAHAIKLANHGQYGLTASIYTEDTDTAKQLARQLNVGVVAINNKAFSHPSYPFGGIKASGYGKELGKEGLMSFCNLKVSVIA